CFRESLPGNAVDAGLGRPRYDLVPMLTKLADKLGPNEPGTANDYDFHGCPFYFDREIASSRSYLQGRTAPGFAKCGRWGLNLVFRSRCSRTRLPFRVT